MATPEEAVGNARDKFSVIEGSLQKAIDKLNAMKKDFADIHAGGPLELGEGVRQFGYLEALMYGAEAQSIAGDIALDFERVIDFHQRCTERAVELGLDGPISMGGGGR